MDRETYEALTASVAKWRKNAAGPADEGLIGVEDCPLCALFWGDFENRCEGCPVREATQQPACSGTPYSDAATALLDFDKGDVTAQSRWQAAAQAEADFLAALVPAGGPDE